MNLFRFFDTLAQHDEAFYDRISDRRTSLRNLGQLGRRAGLAGLGTFLGSVLNKAYAGAGPSAADPVKDTVKFALQLERAELGLYLQARALTIFSATNRAAMDIIIANETGHVDALEATASSLGLNPNDRTMFPLQIPDLTGSMNGQQAPMVPDALTNEMAAIMVLQASEENGGRAYRGNAHNLISNDAVLQAALQIHSVEARHAAHWRMVRGREAWIQRTDLDENTGGKVPAMVYGKTGTTTAGIAYPNESNTTQAGQAGTGYTNVGDDRVAEAFDEGLDPAAVAQLAMPFGFKMPGA